MHGALSAPSPWVVRFASRIPAGEVLDLACGSGRHSYLLAGLGYRVCAVDQDAEALHELAEAGIATCHVDLESGREASWPFAPQRFTGIVATNYLHRPLFSRILDSLAPGRVLIYETFGDGNAHFGKPSNPDFLLRPGELLELARYAQPQPLRVLAFEDGYVDTPKPAMVQRICAIKAADILSSPESLRISPGSPG